jgi:queuosine precursor transporter
MNYKYYIWFVTLALTIELVSQITATKLITIAGQSVSISVLYFPFVLILSDIITEVYGFALARKAMWIVLASSMLATLIYQFVVYYPPSLTYNDELFKNIFAVAPRVFIGSSLAILFGNLSNDYIMSKMKTTIGSQFLWIRTITSTVAGQFLDSVIFYVIALYGIIPNQIMIPAIVTAWLTKVMLEIVITPITCLVISKVKDLENIK